MVGWRHYYGANPFLIRKCNAKIFRINRFGVLYVHNDRSRDNSNANRKRATRLALRPYDRESSRSYSLGQVSSAGFVARDGRSGGEGRGLVPV